MTIFINGKQKRVPWPPMIDGMPVDEFISRNADLIWLHQNEIWELLAPCDERRVLDFPTNGERSDKSVSSA